MLNRSPLILLVLACACADVGDPADYPVPPPATTPAASTTPATTTQESTTASTPAPACIAPGGIWTVQLTPVDAQTATNCGPAARFSKALSDNPIEAAMSEADCNLGRTVADDGCSVLCRKTSAVAGMTTEMLVSFESASSLTGYAVMTGNGVRCEYDLAYTRS